MSLLRSVTMADQAQRTDTAVLSTDKWTNKCSGNQPYSSGAVRATPNNGSKTNGLLEIPLCSRPFSNQTTKVFRDNPITIHKGEGQFLRFSQFLSSGTFPQNKEKDIASKLRAVHLQSIYERLDRLAIYL